MHDSSSSRISKEKPKTISEAFLKNIEKAPVFLQSGFHSGAETIMRREIYGRGCALARKFQSLGVQPGDKVLTILPTGKPFLVSTFGAWCAGAAIVPVAPPVPVISARFYERRLANIIETAQPKIIITCEAACSAINNLAEITSRVRILRDADVLFDFVGEPHPPHISQSDEIAHIQFTSGSTSFPKGAAITHGQIEANVRNTGNVVLDGKLTEDLFVSWLPVHHEMGFIGGLGFPFYHGCDLHLIPTETFIRNPVIWLKTISEARATLSPAPAFAYDLLASRVSDDHLKSVDLSSWRYAWVGAEPIFPKTLQKFNERFARYGLSETTLKPFYALAEATLAVTLAPLAESYKYAFLREDDFAEAAPESEPEAVPVTCCGKAIGETEVKIAGETGAAAEERRQGRILVRGASVMEGYLGNAKSPIDAEGWLDTGDLGFRIGEEIYVTGRAVEKTAGAVYERSRMLSFS